MPQPQDKAPTIQVLVNGEEREIAPGTTVLGLLEKLQMDARSVAVAVNSAVVPRGKLGARGLCEGDRVDIIEAVGGG